LDRLLGLRIILYRNEVLRLPFKFDDPDKLEVSLRQFHGLFLSLVSVQSCVLHRVYNPEDLEKIRVFSRLTAMSFLLLKESVYHLFKKYTKNPYPRLDVRGNARDIGAIQRFFLCLRDLLKPSFIEMTFSMLPIWDLESKDSSPDDVHGKSVATEENAPTIKADSFDWPRIAQVEFERVSQQSPFVMLTRLMLKEGPMPLQRMVASELNIIVEGFVKTLLALADRLQTILARHSVVLGDSEILQTEKPTSLSAEFEEGARDREVISTTTIQLNDYTAYAFARCLHLFSDISSSLSSSIQDLPQRMTKVRDVGIGMINAFRSNRVKLTSQKVLDRLANPLKLIFGQNIESRFLSENEQM